MGTGLRWSNGEDEALLCLMWLEECGGLRVAGKGGGDPIGELMALCLALSVVVGRFTFVATGGSIGEETSLDVQGRVGVLLFSAFRTNRLGIERLFGRDGRLLLVMGRLGAVKGRGGRVRTGTSNGVNDISDGISETEMEGALLA